MSETTYTALVTGAGGFIGSHLVEALARQGHTVRALYHYNSLNSLGWLQNISEDLLANIELVAGNIEDYHSLVEATQGCDVIFHLAALISIPYSYRAPESYVKTNVTGTLNVLQAARATGVRRVIHTSTSEVYGTAQYIPIDESHRLNAQSPYAASKIAADQLALSFHASFDLPVCVVRPFNTYGPRQSLRAVIPAIILQILEGRGRIELGALHPTRDFNFVADTVAGFIAMARAPDIEGMVINLGSGFEISIGDTVALICEVMNANVEIVQAQDRLRPVKSEVDRLYAANDLARSRLDWAPAYGGGDGFRRGIAETVAWLSDPENRKLYKIAPNIL